MLTRDQIVALASTKGRDNIAAAVAKIPQEDLGPDLMFVIMLLQQNIELYEELHARDQKELAELRKSIEIESR